MSTTYFRTQTADRDATDLLVTENQTSTAWSNDELTTEGVSVCDSLDALAYYLATDGQGIPIGSGDWVIVELEGETADHTGHDGERLVHPTRIVTISPMDDDFYALIGAHYDTIYGA